MTLASQGLSRLFALFLVFFAAGSALADCTAFDETALARLTPPDIAEVQTGLRSAYRDTSWQLRDGRLGVYTRARLQDLCVDVPRPPGQDDLRATLELTGEYAGMERLWPNWAKDLFSLTLLGGDGAQASPMLGIRLAGTRAMKTLAIGRRATPYDCADPTGALADHADGARALGVLTRLNRSRSAEEICRMLPVAGGVDDWRAAMDRLGRIASGQRTGALAVLESGDFLRWIGQDAEKRLRRLAGTVPAVLALLDEYARAAPSPGATNYTGGPCSPPRVERTLTYYALQQADVDGLDFLVTLTPKLESFRAEAGGFDSPQALWQALRPVLAEDLDDCILAEIEALVKGPDRLPLAFLLKPSATEALMADRQLESAQAVLTELAPLRTATKAELINRIREGLQTAAEQAVGAEVTTAADTLAAASEPVPPTTDTDILQAEPEEGAPAPTPVITVTDATDQAVASILDNPELTEALRNTPMADATVPELIRSQVRDALAETAARQSQQRVDAQIARIEPAVSSEWTLTEALSAEILALPYVRATTADATADGAQTRLVPLVGVSYPSLRLFDDALRTVSNEAGKVPFSPFVVERIVQKAQKTVDNPQQPRALRPLAIDGCDCIPTRQSEDLTVYGFYPFWLAPTAEALRRVAQGVEGAQPPPPQVEVDFGAVDRLAFYGLEFRPDGDGVLKLLNRERWQEARETFVNSAHRYRAQADLAFDLRDWMRWNDTAIDTAVETIAAEMAPFDRLRSWEFTHLGEAIPNLFDRPQPDGVTLIFHDYDGVRLGKDEMATMIRIIKRVYEALPNRERLAINVAFDFPLVEETTKDGQPVFRPILDEPVFDDLFELLQDNPYVLADADKTAGAAGPEASERATVKVVDKILLFLERPTTDAKKGLRFRMELGLFQGELRRQVLRSIIPVVPPAGHREVRTTIKPNDPDQTPRAPFSQFEDDVVYFKDNFAGIGFWPVPDPLSPETQDETVQLFSIIAANFNAPLLPPRLAGFTEPLEGVCNLLCPNRAAVTLGAMALFVTVVLLTWRSFYSGIVDGIAFRAFGVGMVWIGNLSLLVLLVLLAGCDPLSFWPELLWKLLAAGLLLLMAYNFFQRIKNGPMP